MQPIRILSLNLELLGEIDNYLSFSFTRRYHSPGEFEIVTNRKIPYSDKLTLNNLILLGAQACKVGIIRYREISMNDSGEEILTVKGFSLETILRQRITIPPEGLAYDLQEAAAETVMKHYVQRNCLGIPEMAFPDFTIAADQNRGISLSWQSRYKNLADELEQISLLSGLGWCITLDLSQKRWVFDVFEGQDRTVNQQDRSSVIFSPDFDNIQSQDFCDSIIQYGNYAIVAGQGEGTDRLIQTMGSDATGYLRHVVFVDARDVVDSAGLINRGTSALLDLQEALSFQSGILFSGPFTYQKDWDVGDIVTIQNRDWGITMDSRITEVTEIIEAVGNKLQATFGNRVPTLNKRLRSVINQMNNEITR